MLRVAQTQRISDGLDGRADPHDRPFGDAGDLVRKKQSIGHSMGFRTFMYLSRVQRHSWVRKLADAARVSSRP